MIAALVLQANVIRLVRDPVVAALPPFGRFETVVSSDGGTAMTPGNGALTFWKIEKDGTVTFLDRLRLEGSVGPDSMLGRFVLGPHGNQFAVLPDGASFEVWDRVTGRRTFARRYEPQELWNVRFHPRRPWLVVELSKRSQRIDLRTGDTVEIATRGPLEPLPNSDLLASPDGLFDGKTGKLVRKWRGKDVRVPPVSISPDGKLAMIGAEALDWKAPTMAEAGFSSVWTRTQRFQTWRVSDGKLLRTTPGLMVGDGPDRKSDEVVWQCNRQVLIPALGVVRDPATGRTIRPVPITYLGPQDVPYREQYVVVRGAKGDRLVRLRFSTPGTELQNVGVGTGRLFVLSTQGEFLDDMRAVVTQVSSAGSQTVRRRDGGATEAGFDAKGAYLRSGWGSNGPDGFVLSEFTHRPFGAPLGELRRTTFPTNGPPRPAVVSKVSWQKAWEMREKAGPEPGTPSPPLVGGRLLAVDASHGEELVARSALDGHELWRYRDPDLRLVGRSLPADNRRIAVRFVDQEQRRTALEILNAATGEPLHLIPSEYVWASALSPDGRYVAAVEGDDVAVADLDAPLPTLVKLARDTPIDASNMMMPPVWTSSGRIVVTDDSGFIRIFDPKMGKLVATAWFYLDGTWSALRADGVSDGTHRLDVRLWKDGHWTAMRQHAPFFLNLLK
jgi:WD40 repeat protein